MGLYSFLECAGTKSVLALGTGRTGIGPTTLDSVLDPARMLEEDITVIREWLAAQGDHPVNVRVDAVTGYNEAWMDWGSGSTWTNRPREGWTLHAVPGLEDDDYPPWTAS